MLLVAAGKCRQALFLFARAFRANGTRRWHEILLFRWFQICDLYRRKMTRTRAASAFPQRPILNNGFVNARAYRRPASEPRFIYQSGSTRWINARANANIAIDQFIFLCKLINNLVCAKHQMISNEIATPVSLVCNRYFLFSLDIFIHFISEQTVAMNFPWRVRRQLAHAQIASSCFPNRRQIYLVCAPYCWQFARIYRANAKMLIEFRPQTPTGQII